MTDPLPAIAKHVSIQVQRTGIALIDVRSPQDFVKLCSSMGEVLSVQDVMLVQRSPRHVNNPAPVPLHSDGPQADIVGWYCVRQDELDGASILLDTFPVLRHLSPEVVQSLASIQLPYFDKLSPSRPKGFAPLLLGSDEKNWQVNYAPWLLPQPLDDAQQEAVAAFRLAISSSVSVRTRLLADQCVFVDNWRVLHGRDSLRPTSTRLLKRAWVRTGRASGADQSP